MSTVIAFIMPLLKKHWPLAVAFIAGVIVALFFFRCSQPTEQIKAEITGTASVESKKTVKDTQKKRVEKKKIRRFDDAGKVKEIEETEITEEEITGECSASTATKVSVSAKIDAKLKPCKLWAAGLVVSVTEPGRDAALVLERDFGLFRLHGAFGTQPERLFGQDERAPVYFGRAGLLIKF